MISIFNKREFLNEIRIPTLAGLIIIILGMISGVYLTLRQQDITAKASLNFLPKDVKITNIEDASSAISWITDNETSGYVIYYTKGGSEQTALDDRDNKSPSPKLFHHASLKNLTPSTSYNFKIISEKLTTAPLQFTTASTTDSRNEFKPIVGSVLDNDQFLKDGVVYLEIPGAVLQSTIIKSLGNFILPLSKIRTTDLSNIFQDEDVEARLEVLIGSGQKTSAKLILGKIQSPIGPLRLGEELDLTKQEASPSALLKFDLNFDGIINASDHAIVLTNFGKNPKVPRADLNEDGVVDKEDLEIISAEIAKLGNE